MKSEAEINKMVSDMKDGLVDATGEGIPLLQGFLRGLNWVLSDEKPQDGFSEET